MAGFLDSAVERIKKTAVKCSISHCLLHKQALATKIDHSFFNVFSCLMRCGDLERLQFLLLQPNEIAFMCRNIDTITKGLS